MINIREYEGDATREMVKVRKLIQSDCDQYEDLRKWDIRRGNIIRYYQEWLYGRIRT